MCGNCLRRSFLALFFVALFGLSSQVAQAQVTPSSTSNAQNSPSQPQTEKLPFDKALKQALELSKTWLQESLDSKAKAESLQLQVDGLQIQVANLSSQLAQAQTQVDESSKSLQNSLQNESALKKAADAQHNADQKAITQARSQRDLWMYGTIGASVAAVAALVYAAIK